LARAAPRLSGYGGRVKPTIEPRRFADGLPDAQGGQADEAVKVLVFKSADADYFIPHVDVTKIKEYRDAELTGEASLGPLFRHVSASRLVTIAQIEGRARAAGSEFVLACDMRFAARESAIFSQPEPAFGQVPGAGGGPTPRAPYGPFEGP
jgi:enoyl-CoA hydratase/carnithine racemase